MASSNRCPLLIYCVGRATVNQTYRYLQFVVFVVSGWQIACLGVACKQLMKTFRVTVGETWTCSISFFPKLRNNVILFFF